MLCFSCADLRQTLCETIMFHLGYRDLLMTPIFYFLFFNLIYFFSLRSFLHCLNFSGDLSLAVLIKFVLCKRNSNSEVSALESIVHNTAGYVTIKCFDPFDESKSKTKRLQCVSKKDPVSTVKSFLKINCN